VLERNYFEDLGSVRAGGAEHPHQREGLPFLPFVRIAAIILRALRDLQCARARTNGKPAVGDSLTQINDSAPSNLAVPPGRGSWLPEPKEDDADTVCARAGVDGAKAEYHYRRVHRIAVRTSIAFSPAMVGVCAATRGVG
jgi:hypothetical protein